MFFSLSHCPASVSFSHLTRKQQRQSVPLRQHSSWMAAQADYNVGDNGMGLKTESSERKRSKNWRKDDGIVIVDHGSRRSESNLMLNAFVELYKQQTGHSIVEPAHMEIATPTISEAFGKCIEQGACRVIVAPYFLSPGRHWDRDIPALAAEAAKAHSKVPYIVTAPIGLHRLMVDIIEDRIEYCLSQVAGDATECEMCMGSGRCRILQPQEASEKVQI